MDQKENHDEIVTKLVRMVLKNRIDIKKQASGHIDDITSYILKNTPFMEILQNQQTLQPFPEEMKDDYPLLKIIQLLAIINRTVETYI